MAAMFWSGVLFGVSMTLLALLLGIAIYVRMKGGFTIAPPSRPIELPNWFPKKNDDA